MFTLSHLWLSAKVKRGRNIQGWKHEKVLEELKKYTIANYETYKKLSQIVEPLLEQLSGSLVILITCYLGRGLDSANAEVALIGVAYNFKRLTKIKKVLDITEVLVAL